MIDTIAAIAGKDSIVVLYKALDTSQIYNSTAQPNDMGVWMPLLGVLLGAIIGSLANYLLFRMQAKDRIERELFLMRMKACQEIVEVLIETCNTTIEPNHDGGFWSYPSAYKNFQELVTWNNKVSELFVKHRLLLNQAISDKHFAFMQVVMVHIQEVELNNDQDLDNDQKCKMIGIRDQQVIINYNNEVLEVIKKFIEKKYKIELE